MHDTVNGCSRKLVIAEHCAPTRKLKSSIAYRDKSVTTIIPLTMAQSG